MTFPLASCDCAAVLAACLAAPGPDPLARYERLRKPRTRQIQFGARANAACFRLPDGPPATERNARLPHLPDTVSWIHGYDVYADLT